MTDATAPNAVIVLGMHRSGTSAVAGALGVLGVSLGDRLVSPAPDNPRGYFEHADAVILHERLLAAVGSCWEDPRDLPAGWPRTPAAHAAENAAGKLIAEQFANAPLWALKDPRQCRLLPVWQRAFAEHGIRPAYLLVVRDPSEVAQSLHARDGLGRTHALVLWLQYLLDAERDSRAAPRAMLSYERLLSDPVAALDGAASALGLAWPSAPTDVQEALVDFLDPGARHHRAAPAPAGEGLAAAAQAVYRQCLAVEQGASWPELDAVRQLVAAELHGADDWASGLVHALAQARSAFSALEARLADTDRALGHAGELSQRQLQELHALNSQLGQTGEALETATRLSLERLAAMAALDDRLRATDQALADVTELSLQRLVLIDERQQTIVEQQNAIDRLQHRVMLMEQSLSWRLTRPLRAMAAWWRGDGGRGDGS